MTKLECADEGATVTEGVVGLVVDLDGVVTDTASTHARSWKRAFDELLESRAERSGGRFHPFDPDADYSRYVDGKPRYEGAKDFLDSRGISLPFGEPSDPPTAETVCGIANRKNEYFREELRENGVDVYATSVSFLEDARRGGIRTAMMTSSRNGRDVVAAAGVDHLFDVILDGTDAAELGLPGKPEPAMLVEAARRMHIEPSRTGVLEDALSGVEAGRRGGFGLVIGIDRTGHREELRRAGADIVVDDLGELGHVRPGCVVPRAGARHVGELPSALGSWAEIEQELRGMRPALFLDYDGTLTPIVQRPELAVLDSGMREVIQRLAARMPVAILSGRDAADVRDRVGVEGVYYAGSHGFEILGPDGKRLHTEHDAEIETFAADLAEAGRELERVAQGIEGMLVERKAYAVATHYRLVPERDVERVASAVGLVAERHPRLRVTGGKKILELRPGVEWDKGLALLRLVAATVGGSSAVPLFLGDDVTDEDAFRVLLPGGIGIVVAVEDRETLARYRLNDVAQVQAFLRKLAGIGGAA